jgi:hypothetical protein
VIGKQQKRQTGGKQWCTFLYILREIACDNCEAGVLFEIRGELHLSHTGADAKRQIAGPCVWCVVF